MTETPPVVAASRYVRTMRGGAHAALIEAADGHHYVVKFLQSPQGRRTVINELICSVLSRKLGVLSPETAFISVDDEFLRLNPTCMAYRAGTHFGSRHPGTQNSAVVYDVLPKTMLPEVYNRNHFLGALVLDKWTSNADGRQAIFYRANVRHLGKTSIRWIAAMIDNGHAFQWRDWVFRDSIPQGLYCRSVVYGEFVNLRDFDPWLESVMSTSPEIVDEIFALVPREWLESDEVELRQLLNQLLLRRKRVRNLVLQSVEWMNAQKAKSHPSEPVRTRSRLEMFTESCV